MEISELLALIATPEDLIKKVEALKTAPEADQYFEPENHKVTKTEHRKNKTVNKPTGSQNQDGSAETIAVEEKVNRVTVSMQKLIVDRAVAFVTGVPIEYMSEPKAGPETIMDEMLRKTIRDNKVTYKDAEILELTMRDKEAAEIWYSEAVEPEYWEGTGAGSFKMRLKIVAPSRGDMLYPIFNSEGDMVAFARGHKTKVESKEVEHLDLYTDKLIYKYTKTDSDWILSDSVSISYGKIPVIYHSQARTETADVNGKIERLETLLSNHADTNDYNGSPILAASGAIEGFSAKGEQGKVFELEAGADLKYVTWNNAPESIKMEIENLIEFIYTETRTPNFSPTAVKGLGAISGIALKLLFLDAHLKAKKRQNGIFGEAIQRRINFLKAAVSAININIKAAANLDITPKFDLYMPDNESEIITNITTLVAAGVLSRETALRKLAKILDMEPEEVDAELERLKVELDAIGAL